MKSIIEQLKDLLNSRPDLEQALAASLKNAGQGVDTLKAFYDFLQLMLSYIPTESEINTNEEKFYKNNELISSRLYRFFQTLYDIPC